MIDKHAFQKKWTAASLASLGRARQGTRMGRSGPRGSPLTQRRVAFDVSIVGPSTASRPGLPAGSDGRARFRWFGGNFEPHALESRPSLRALFNARGQATRSPGPGLGRWQAPSVTIGGFPPQLATRRECELARDRFISQLAGSNLGFVGLVRQCEIQCGCGHESDDSSYESPQCN